MIPVLIEKITLVSTKKTSNFSAYMEKLLIEEKEKSLRNLPCFISKTLLL